MRRARWDPASRLRSTARRSLSRALERDAGALEVADILRDERPTVVLRALEDEVVIEVAVPGVVLRLRDGDHIMTAAAELKGDM